MNIDKVLILASGLIINQKGEVLLLLQRSKKSSYPDYWQLVEGKLEKGESPVKAVKREVNEETGALALNLKLNSVFYDEIDAKRIKYLCFRIVFKTTISLKKLKTCDEHVSFGWFNKKNALKLQLLPGTKKILTKLM